MFTELGTRLQKDGLVSCVHRGSGLVYWSRFIPELAVVHYGDEGGGFPESFCDNKGLNGLLIPSLFLAISILRK